MLPVLLHQRRELLTYLESSIAEITRCFISSAHPPLTCLECPLHEEECTPHVVLNLRKKDVLVRHEELLASVIPEKFYTKVAIQISSSITLVYCRIIILTYNIFCFACVA